MKIIISFVPIYLCTRKGEPVTADEAFLADRRTVPTIPAADKEVIPLLVRLVQDAKRLAGENIEDGGDQQLQNWRDMFFKNGI